MPARKKKIERRDRRVSPAVKKQATAFKAYVGRLPASPGAWKKAEEKLDRFLERASDLHEKIERIERVNPKSERVTKDKGGELRLASLNIRSFVGLAEAMQVLFPQKTLNEKHRLFLESLMEKR